jgi:CRISPR system Cascade subunit CasD
MAVLALRLGGPLQAWGSAQRLDGWRRTEQTPTKSAVVGIVAAALGRRRDADIADLATLRFGVRSDRLGEWTEDFHTVSSIFDEKGRFTPGRGRLPKAAGGYLSADVSTKITRRHYLADACFVAALEGEERTVRAADAALARPAFPLYLGRRCCPPDRPLRLGVYDGTLEEVLTSLPWQATPRRSDPGLIACEALVEDPAGDVVSTDQPRGFHPVSRSYIRRVSKAYPVTLPNPAAPGGLSDGHDPMALLGGGPECT